MTTLEEILEAVKDPEIRKLVLALQDLPKHLEEEKKKREEHEEFCRYVWEDACRQAGLIK